MASEVDILELVIKMTYHGLGRIIFGRKFDTGEEIPFWKKFTLSCIAILIGILLISATVFGFKYIMTSYYYT